MVTDMYLVNSNCSVTLARIGLGGFPLLVVDEFLLQPHKLKQWACECAEFSNDNSDFYPGLRAPLPQDYAAGLPAQIKPLLQSVMGASGLSLECLFHAFSLTITPPAQLKPIQCIPHFDDENPLKLAMVLYLFEHEFGGTSFYRHNKTRFEALTPENSDHYMKILMSQASTDGLPDAAYINGDTRLFTRYHSVPAKFNRCILYPSNILHSGDINPLIGLSAEPSKGRLTANMALLMS